LHIAQQMPLPLTISCSSKSRLVLPFWYLLTRVVPDIFQKSSKMVVCFIIFSGEHNIIIVLLEKLVTKKYYMIQHFVNVFTYLLPSTHGSCYICKFSMVSSGLAVKKACQRELLKIAGFSTKILF